MVCALLPCPIVDHLDPVKGRRKRRPEWGGGGEGGGKGEERKGGLS